MKPRPFASATERNGQPILGALRHEFREVRSVLEIGSGTGQHATRFGAAMPRLEWQPSDLAAQVPGIRSWLESMRLPNVSEPIVLDVTAAPAQVPACDAVFSANTAHIMCFAAVRGMLALAGRLLRPGGVFCLYGPFQRGGGFNSQSNAEFDKSLRLHDPDMGIRHLEDLDCLAREAGLHRLCLYAMPANNYMVLWKRAVTGGQR